MNHFTIVNITPHVRDSLEDKFMLFYSKKALLFPSVWPGTEYTWALILKESLLICLESCQGISLFPDRQRVDRNVNTFLMVHIKPTCNG